MSTKRRFDDYDGMYTNSQHAPISNPTKKFRSGADLDEVLKQKIRLEKWKKKLSQHNLLKKLEEQLQKLNCKENVPISSNNHSLHTNDKQNNNLMINTGPRLQVTTTTRSPTNHHNHVPSASSAEGEIDTLDAFMSEISDQVNEGPQPNHDVYDEDQDDISGKTITYDEIFKSDVANEATSESETSLAVDDETFHQQFLEAIRKKEESNNSNNKQTNEKKHVVSSEEAESVDQANDDREVYFPDDDTEDAAAVDHYFTTLYDSSLVASTNSAAKNKKDLKPVDHSKMTYLPFRKNFYIIPRELKELSSEEVYNMRKGMSNIRIRGKGCPPPVKTWVQCGLDDSTLSIIEGLGYTHPFPIQAQSIPCIMSGKNVIGIAKTGSGKTLAYVLPMIRHILDQPPLRDGDGPIGLIISPTRELATQIYAELLNFSKSHGLRAVCAYGGASIAEQIAALKRGAHLIVCTPGRMIDLLCANRGRVTNLARVTYIVLDEADRMFDMGFGPQVTRIVNNVRPDRQVVLFSATFPKPLEALAQQTLKDSIEIIVGSRSVVAENIKQYVELRDESTKFLRLLELLGVWRDKGNVLIFVDKQTEVGNLYKDLLMAGYETLCMHGGMDQVDRDDTIQQFKKKEKTIMIATSVAARGLHVDDLVLVVNYTVPNHYEDYVHRVGRTGRAGKEGTAYTFVTPDEERYTPDLVKALKQSNNEVPPELEQIAKQFLEKKKGGLVGKQYPTKLSGFTGSGFKFDLSEQNKKKEEMRRQMKTLGVEETTVELLSDDEDEKEKEEDVDSMIKHVKKGEVVAPTPVSAPITIIPHATIPKVTTGMSAVEKAKAFASALNITTSFEAANIPLANASAASATSLHTPPNTAILPNPTATNQDHYETEIEINDYPQQARWEVTHKDAMYEVHEYTGAEVTTKGIYVEPGHTVPTGERRLYLLVEGPTHESVRRARMFIKRKLDQARIRAESTETRTVGRFSIF